MNLFRLVLGDFDRSLDLPFDTNTEDRLADLMLGIEEGSPKQVALARWIASALSALGDEFIEPPTEKQLRYANAIAVGLGLELRQSAKTDIRVMRKFLSEHAPAYRRKRSEEKRQGKAIADLRERFSNKDPN